VFLLVPAYPGCPRPKAVKRLCVCVCVCVCTSRNVDAVKTRAARRSAVVSIYPTVVMVGGWVLHETDDARSYRRTNGMLGIDTTNIAIIAQS